MEPRDVSAECSFMPCSGPFFLFYVRRRRLVSFIGVRKRGVALWDRNKETQRSSAWIHATGQKLCGLSRGRVSGEVHGSLADVHLDTCAVPENGEMNSMAASPSVTAKDHQPTSSPCGALVLGRPVRQHGTEVREPVMVKGSAVA